MLSSRTVSSPLPRAAVVALLLAVLGCGRDAGRVAVIDLDRVAHAVGRDDQLNRELQAAQAESERQLGALRDQLQAQVSSAAEQLKEPRSDAQKQQLEALRAQGQAQLDRAQAEVKQRAQEHKNGLVAAFWDQVRPVARKVAADRGLSVVLIRGEQVFDAAPSADITDAVSDELRRRESEAPAPGQPPPPTQPQLQQAPPAAKPAVTPPQPAQH